MREKGCCCDKRLNVMLFVIVYWRIKNTPSLCPVKGLAQIWRSRLWLMQIANWNFWTVESSFKSGFWNQNRIWKRNHKINFPISVLELKWRVKTVPVWHVNERWLGDYDFTFQSCFPITVSYSPYGRSVTVNRSHYCTATVALFLHFVRNWWARHFGYLCAS